MSLFAPIKVGKSELKHKIVLAPMTRMRAPGNVPSESTAEFYAQRSARPGTLVITEATFVSEAAGGYGSAPGIWNDEQIESWSSVFSKVHENKSTVFLQLGALGRQSAPKNADTEPAVRVVSASGGEYNGHKVHALTTTEVQEYVRAYAQAATNAIQAGADGVEIHAANGYMSDQFLHANTNQRNDQYGGSIENRARFVLEIVDALSEAIGAEKVAIRLSPWNEFNDMDPKITGSSPIPQFSYLISELQARAEAGKPLAYIHLMENMTMADYLNDELKENARREDKDSFVRGIWSGPLIRAGGMHNYAKQVVEDDDNTLVAFGRYFISNPDLVDRIEHKHPLAKFDFSTFYTSDPKGYTDYPTYSEVQVQA